MENKNIKILVIVPAFNEEKNINFTVTDLKDHFPNANIIVIDDGSQDKTYNVLQQMSVKVIKLPINLGIGGAVQTGFKYACRSNYDIAVQFDGDSQHIASEIPKIIAPILENKADIVIGSRFCDPNYIYELSFFRKIGITIFRLINRLVTGKTITDNTSGFRAYNRKTIEYLINEYPVDYPEPESIVSLILNGFRITEVSVKMRKRPFGKSSIRAVYYMYRVTLGIILSYLKAKE